MTFVNQIAEIVPPSVALRPSKTMQNAYEHKHWNHFEQWG